MPLKSKIFTGVSFRKILGFYYKRERQLFYYEGTSSYIPLKIPERVNSVISQNSSELFLLKISSRQKHVQSKKKGMFQERCSGAFMISSENIFEVCDRV